MFFELEFEPDGHRCVLKQIVAQGWKNDMHLYQTEWLGRARGNQQHRPMTHVLSGFTLGAKDGSR